MIAKSDLVILLVSVSLLAGGIYRWQQKLSTSGRPASVAGMPVAPGAAARVDGTAIERGGRELGTIAPATQTGTGRQATGSSTASPLTAGVESREGAAAGAPAKTPANTPAGAPAGSSAGADTGTSLSEPLYGVHVVKSGEYLGKIAQMYGTTVATLREINGISGSLIEVDQQILYPLPAN